MVQQMNGTWPIRLPQTGRGAHRSCLDWSSWSAASDLKSERMRPDVRFIPSAFHNILW